MKESHKVYTNDEETMHNLLTSPTADYSTLLRFCSFPPNNHTHKMGGKKKADSKLLASTKSTSQHLNAKNDYNFVK